MHMTIERTEKEIIIKIPMDWGVEDIQRMLDYLSYKQAIRNSQATTAQIDLLAKEVKKGWWEKNKHWLSGLQE
ncbi:MAG: hypothetical protein R3C61_03855 [Bacteroidia bacterium]